MFSIISISSLIWLSASFIALFLTIIGNNKSIYVCLSLFTTGVCSLILKTEIFYELIVFLSMSIIYCLLHLLVFLSESNEESSKDMIRTVENKSLQMTNY